MEKVLHIFLEDPKKELHLREIARICKISPSTAAKYADELVQKDILQKKAFSNHIIYAKKEGYAFEDELRHYTIKKFRSYQKYIRDAECAVISGTKLYLISPNICPANKSIIALKTKDFNNKDIKKVLINGTVIHGELTI